MNTGRAREIGTRFARIFREADVTGVAAELAYRFLFAIFPFGLFLAALAAFVAGWLGIDNPAQRILDGLGDNLPPDLAGSVRPELEHVIGQTRPELVSIGALGALWAATGGTSALMKAMNRAYEVEESRSFIHKLVVAVALTIMGSIGVLASFVTIVGGAFLTEELAQQLGLSGAAWTIVTLLRWPAVFLVLVGMTAILFRLAPNVTASWRWCFIGGAIFATGWLVATWGFAFYVANFANYGATYGSLGGIIVLMLWFYLTGIMLVGSAALTVVLAQVVEPEALQRRRDEISEARLEAAKNGLRARLARLFGRGRPSGEGQEPDRRSDVPDRRTGPSDRRGSSLQREPGAG